MGFLKKNLWLIFILFLAIFLRLNYDVFINGYNFDELAMVSIAKQAFPFGIFKALSELDYHAPLYYIIIHPFTYFENEWIYLRALNVLISLINVYVFYKIGCLLNNKKTGLVLALILAVNHLAIGTVSFVKFYCLCFLLTSINLYYFIKILKQNKGYKKFGYTNFLLILSSTFGFIFVLIEYFVLKKKESLKTIYIPLLGFLIYLPILIKQIILSKETILSPHLSYANLSPYSIYALLNDYFTPLINYSCNLITVESLSYIGKFINSIQDNNLDIASFLIILFLSIIPIAISIYAITLGIIKNKIIKNLSYVAIGYFIFFIFLILFEKTGFIPIYLYPFGIITFIALALGLESIKSKKISTLLISYLILAQLIIPNCYPIKKRGVEKAKIYYGFEKYIKQNQEQNVVYITTNGARFLKKYYKNENIIEFDDEKLSGKNGREFIGLFFNEEIKKLANKENFKNLIQEKVLNNDKNTNFEQYFNNNILKNEKIVLAFYADETPFLLQDREIKNILLNYKYFPHLTRFEDVFNDKKILNSEILSKIVLTHAYKQLFADLEKNYRITKITQYAKTINNDYIKISEITNLNKSTLWIAQNGLLGWFFITYEKLN